MISNNTNMLDALNRIDGKIDQILSHQMQFATTLINHADKFDTIRGDVQRIDDELSLIRARLAVLETDCPLEM
jgi:hypothetical protein